MPIVGLVFDKEDDKPRFIFQWKDSSRTVHMPVENVEIEPQEATFFEKVHELSLQRKAKKEFEAVHGTELERALGFVGPTTPNVQNNTESDLPEDPLDGAFMDSTDAVKSSGSQHSIESAREMLLSETQLNQILNDAREQVQTEVEAKYESELVQLRFELEHYKDLVFR